MNSSEPVRPDASSWLCVVPDDRTGAGVYQADSSAALDAFCGPFRTGAAHDSHPRLGRVGTKLSYCNGEIGPGSSNITLYIVWGCGRPRCIAQTLQQTCTFMVETETEVGEPRERNKASVFDCWKQLEKTVPHCDAMFPAVAERGGHSESLDVTCSLVRALRDMVRITWGAEARILAPKTVVSLGELHRAALGGAECACWRRCC